MIINQLHDEYPFLKGKKTHISKKFLQQHTDFRIIQIDNA